MEELGEQQVDWAAIAQAAFDREIDNLKWKKETGMNAVIERLRASKEEDVALLVEEGKESGREWAMHLASYRVLRRLSKLDTDEYRRELDQWRDAGEMSEWVNQQLGNSSEEDSVWNDLKDYDQPNAQLHQIKDDEFVMGFIEGAKEVWDEVKGKL